MNRIRPVRIVAALTAGMFPVVTLAEVPTTSRPLRFERVQLIDNLNESCAVADVNNNGRLDLIAGPWWFENPTWKKHPIRDMEPTGPKNEYMDTNGYHAIDLNGDGWVDIISASWFSGDIHWYENPGREGLGEGRKWPRHLLASSYPTCEGTLFEDLDGNGVPELIINHWERQRPVTVIRIQPGRDGRPPEFTPVVVGDANGHGMAVGDVNGNGRLDLLFQHGWYEAPEGDRFAARWKYHEAFGIDKSASLPFLVADVNRNGRSDVIVGYAHDYGLFWLEQGPARDGPTQWTRHEIDKTFSQAHCLAWADLDGDGREELITGKRWRGHAGSDPGHDDPICLFRYVWNPERRRFERDIISYDQGVGTGMQIRTADIDGDGRLDVIVAGKTGTYILFNRGPAEPEPAGAAGN
jgi:hypothetical protein